jgi:hypothetical protein
MSTRRNQRRRDRRMLEHLANPTSPCYLAALSLNRLHASHSWQNRSVVSARHWSRMAAKAGRGGLRHHSGSNASARLQLDAAGFAACGISCRRRVFIAVEPEPNALGMLSSDRVPNGGVLIASGRRIAAPLVGRMAGGARRSGIPIGRCDFK